MSTASTPTMMPVTPPMVKRKRNDSAYNIGVFNHTDPLYIVATQLNTLIPDGIPIRYVINENMTDEIADCPDTNM